jgi:hypothetical protein
MASEDASSFEKLRAALETVDGGSARSQFKIFGEFAQQWAGCSA